MKYSFHSATHVGKVRSNNEDYFLNSEIEGGHVLVVCDGMGGHNGGEIAARIAAESVTEYFSGNDISNIPKSLNAALSFANENILLEASKYPELKGMGTTVNVVVAHKNKFYFGHVGDSRIYAVYNGNIRCLTKDHSFVQQLLDYRELTEKEVLNHPMRNIITKALGTAFDSNFDYFDGEISLPNNTYLLLCTDGLNGMISDLDMLSAFNEEDPKRIANTLIQEAINAGGSDNVTVSVIKIIESPFHKTDIVSNSFKNQKTKGPFNWVKNIFKSK